MLCFIKIFFSPFLTLVIICLSTIVSSFYALCVCGGGGRYFSCFSFCIFSFYFLFICLFFLLPCFLLREREKEIPGVGWWESGKIWEEMREGKPQSKYTVWKINYNKNINKIIVGNNSVNDHRTWSTLVFFYFKA